MRPVPATLTIVGTSSELRKYKWQLGDLGAEDGSLLVVQIDGDVLKKALHIMICHIISLKFRVIFSL